MGKKPKLIQSVQRAINILECFDLDKTELSLSEISEMLDLNQSTVHGILLTLQVNSYIEKVPERFKYKLGSKLVEKAYLALGNLDLREIAHPYLDLLAKTFKITAYLCLYKYNTLYVIDKAESTHSHFYMTAEMGIKIPLHSSASGRLILAHLDPEKLNETLKNLELEKLTEHTVTDIESIKRNLLEVKEQGYSFENEETELGLYTVAAPIFNHKGEILGTIGMLGPRTPIHMNPKKGELLKTLLDYSKKISKSMGYNE